MNTQARKHRFCQDRHGSEIAFRMITLVHDNPLLPFLKDPFKRLAAAGVKRGQQVLEVGCGPGYFTLAAAEMVGPQGRVYAVDVTPRAICRVQAKAKAAGVKNIRPLLTNASDTGLAIQSVDLAFMFGLPRIAGGWKALIREIQRVLKPGGILAVQKSRGAEKTLIDDLQRRGFVFLKKEKRVLRFQYQGQSA